MAPLRRRLCQHSHVDMAYAGADVTKAHKPCLCDIPVEQLDWRSGLSPHTIAGTTATSYLA